MIQKSRKYSNSATYPIWFHILSWIALKFFKNSEKIFLFLAKKHRSFKTDQEILLSGHRYLPEWNCHTIEDVIDWYMFRRKILEQVYNFPSEEFGPVDRDTILKVDKKQLGVNWDTPLNELYRELTNPGVYETKSRNDFSYGTPVDRCETCGTEKKDE